jgi:HSP20 family molecular chaperone IbpA
LEVDLPGVKEKDVSAHIDDGDLVLTGRRVCDRVTVQRSFHRHERQFIRQLWLPASVASTRVTYLFSCLGMRATSTGQDA